MFRKEHLLFLICVLVTKAFCSDKRLLGTHQNNTSSQLESIVSKLQITLQQTQKKLSDLEKKVANLEHTVGFTACHTKIATLGDEQTVVYDKVISNVGQAYNAKDGEFRAPYTGLYSFSFTGMAYFSTSMHLYLVKNGAYIGQVYSNDAIGDSGTITINIDLQANDMVWIRNGSGAGSRLHDLDYNCFSGILVRQI